MRWYDDLSLRRIVKDHVDEEQTMSHIENIETQLPMLIFRNWHGPKSLLVHQYGSISQVDNTVR